LPLIFSPPLLFSMMPPCYAITLLFRCRYLHYCHYDAAFRSGALLLMPRAAPLLRALLRCR